MQSLKSNRGFTLMEVLVSLVIFSISLAALLQLYSVVQKQDAIDVNSIYALEIATSTLESEKASYLRQYGDTKLKIDPASLPLTFSKPSKIIDNLPYEIEVVYKLPEPTTNVDLSDETPYDQLILIEVKVGHLHGVQTLSAYVSAH